MEENTTDKVREAIPDIQSRVGQCFEIATRMRIQVVRLLNAIKEPGPSKGEPGIGPGLERKKGSIERLGEDVTALRNELDGIAANLERAMESLLGSDI